ncbi:MAG: sulfate adenylyltransferase subunit 2 [Actinobacteria bacterium]|jgi:sulfate adenylyltransferase subunit 2|nr:sulfate adenylyltransferase subunit 2 [Actinomycetota bacterium]MCL6105099.1 sulfate adenylyltransferase subunit 2 [Actinomycetota bacterium]
MEQIKAQSQNNISNLKALEDEAVFIMREVAAECERPVLLFSGGKDSAVLLRLAEKAFRPGGFPFPIMHIDTGHNFEEVINFRDKRARELGEKLIVASVQDTIDKGRAVEHAPGASRNRIQSITLMDAVAEWKFDALIGGARRDEDKARAKERVLSLRDRFGHWDPRNQRPELWNLYHAKVRSGEHLRAFPLSNWTELDVWNYIAQEKLGLPPIYFAHKRLVFYKDSALMAVTPFLQPTKEEKAFMKTVRFRTVGDATCTAAISSHAVTVQEVINEISSASVSERGSSRVDDHFSEHSMEDRKKEGYF